MCLYGCWALALALALVLVLVLGTGGRQNTSDTLFDVTMAMSPGTRGGHCCRFVAALLAASIVCCSAGDMQLQEQRQGAGTPTLVVSACALGVQGDSGLGVTGTVAGAHCWERACAGRMVTMSRRGSDHVITTYAAAGVFEHAYLRVLRALQGKRTNLLTQAQATATCSARRRMQEAMPTLLCQRSSSTKPSGFTGTKARRACCLGLNCGLAGTAGTASTQVGRLAIVLPCTCVCEVDQATLGSGHTP